MCGIAGLFTETSAERGPIAIRMAKALQHRGPDDHGFWEAPEEPLAFAHRRLSILDLSPLGRQPMSSSTGRYIITFNGEIYNFSELRAELLTFGASFQGSSDTEVMLAAFERWGVSEALKRFVGMFAFAVWDRSERLLYLARDRMGEKPLYFGWVGKGFVFGSELAALRVFPGFSPSVNRDALVLFLRHNCVPAPHSIYEGVYKLLPGTYLCLSREHMCGGGRDFSPWPGGGAKISPVRYWNRAETLARKVAFAPKEEEEALFELERVLSRAVKSQMVSDVPVGAFLSGGIDSSLIVSLMQVVGSGPVKTFSIGFKQDDYNEAHHAAKVAAHLGTDHTELYCTSEEALRVIPKLALLYSEPFADSSQIPTYLVSKLARTKVTVSLSGDGGDELFGGYTRFVWADRAWRILQWMPYGLRSLCAGLIRAPGGATWERALSPFSGLLKTRFGIGNAATKVLCLADLIQHRNREALYQELLVHWRDAQAVVESGTAGVNIFDQIGDSERGREFLDEMMYLDSVSYLPDDILVKVDRAAMGVSLESRAPFLDHRVVEFAARLPVSFKLRSGITKWPLRQLLYKRVPQELVDRPKMGFGVPLDSWLRGELKVWADSLLSAERLRREGFFKPEPIQEKWKEHLTGRRNWQYLLWDVLMFQAWLETERAGPLVAPIL